MRLVGFLEDPSLCFLVFLGIVADNFFFHLVSHMWIPSLLNPLWVASTRKIVTPIDASSRGVLTLLSNLASLLGLASISWSLLAICADKLLHLKLVYFQSGSECTNWVLSEAQSGVGSRTLQFYAVKMPFYVIFNFSSIFFLKCEKIITSVILDIKYT